MITILDTPFALPVRVRVPTLTFVAPRATAVPVKSTIRTVKEVAGPGNVEGVVIEAHAGEVKPVMSATAAFDRVTVYSAPIRPVGAESKTIGTETVPPTAGMVLVPVVTVAADAPVTMAQSATRARARRRDRPVLT